MTEVMVADKPRRNNVDYQLKLRSFMSRVQDVDGLLAALEIKIACLPMSKGDRKIQFGTRTMTVLSAMEHIEDLKTIMAGHRAISREFNASYRKNGLIVSRVKNMLERQFGPMLALQENLYDVIKQVNRVAIEK